MTYIESRMINVTWFF